MCTISTIQEGVFIMEHSLISVLIVDDENIVREGLKHVINWKESGYYICDEAGTGKEALEKIKLYEPGLVLMDIKMPNMYGTKLIEAARDLGCTSEFIVLSGYSDFSYAQTVLHYGACAYLTKPIDEDELIKAINNVKAKIKSMQSNAISLKQYLKKAKTTVLRDILTAKDYDSSINYLEMGLYAPIYQVVIYEGYTPFFSSYSFSDLLKVTNQDNDSFEHIVINNNNVILLKGNFALKRFNECLSHYEAGTQKGSPLDSIFLTYGHIVTRICDIHSSYNDCVKLLKRRFFCDENQHVLSFEDLPVSNDNSIILSPNVSERYSSKLVNYIQSYNRRMISQTLTDIKLSLFDTTHDILCIKHFLTDIFLQIKQSIMFIYETTDIPFAHNAAIIELVENKYYLYEILLYFTEQFEMIIRAIGNSSSESIFDDILYYIEHNYMTSLKLESIAPLFGYNSSYLGKLFSQKTGDSFNYYLDKVRIEHSKELLVNSDMKVYEIATKVGYKNVDYFHLKFKRHMNMTPAEYRKQFNLLLIQS